MNQNRFFHVWKKISVSPHPSHKNSRSVRLVFVIKRSIGSVRLVFVIKRSIAHFYVRGAGSSEMLFSFSIFCHTPMVRSHNGIAVLIGRTLSACATFFNRCSITVRISRKTCIQNLLRFCRTIQRTRTIGYHSCGTSQ